MRAFFDRELNTIATIWRIYRADGVTLGFTSHNDDITFDGIRHKSAPGMVPAAIRLTADLTDDSAEVAGILSHDAIRELDLVAGLFDNAAIEVGAVDWETRECHILYFGKIGQIDDDTQGFSAELRSAKSMLEIDLVPRSSPTCRADFCGAQCGLSAPAYTSVKTVTSVSLDSNSIEVADLQSDDFADGQVRFLSGPQTGIAFGIVSVDQAALILDRPLASDTTAGIRAEILEGCDHSHTTCSNRFDNIVNFRGEPHLPGNDLLARYG